ncbi:MAG: DNA primase [Rhodospirillaceae bacterium]
MAFPPAFLEELRARLPLSEVVGKRLRLVRAGREFQAPCPFHNEKTPSFTVNDAKGFFHCFGCGAHGDVIGFVMRHDHLTFPEAVETLAGQAGLPVPRTAPEERQRYERQKSLHEVVEAAARWFEAQLRQPAGSAALAYLRRRGLDDAALAAFRLGYAPPDGSGLRLALEREGFEVKDMLEAGLVKQPSDGNRAPFGFFRHRVMFPVADRRGRIVAFGGRLIEGDGPKYINTGETPLFHKGQLLYGLSRARQAAAEGKPVIVVEGYMDVIALVRAGYEGAVAPLGTAMTETQIETAWKLYPGRERFPVLCFDGDTAGKRAAFRAVERVLPLLRPDQSVRVAFLPSGEDPDSLIRAKGAAAFESVLAAARSLVDVLWEMETEGRAFETPEAKAGLEAALNARVDAIADRGVQNFYRDEMRRRLREAFWNRPARSDRAGSPPGTFGPRAPARPPRPGAPRLRPVAASGGPPLKAPRPPAGLRPRILLATLINHPELLEEHLERLAEVDIAAPGLAALRQTLIAAAAEAPGADAAGLRRHLEARGQGEALDDLLGATTYVHASFALPEADSESVRRGLADLYATLCKARIGRELREAGRQLGEHTTTQNLSRVMVLRGELDTPPPGLDDQD